MKRKGMLNKTTIEKPSNNTTRRGIIAINKESIENPTKRTIPTTTGPVSGSLEIMLKSCSIPESLSMWGALVHTDIEDLMNAY